MPPSDALLHLNHAMLVCEHGRVGVDLGDGKWSFIFFGGVYLKQVCAKRVGESKMSLFESTVESQ